LADYRKNAENWQNHEEKYLQKLFHGKNLKIKNIKENATPLLNLEIHDIWHTFGI
jgi:hypothetical protein